MDLNWLKNEYAIWIGILIAMFIFYFFLLDAFTPFFEQNFVLSFVLFFIGLNLIALKFIVNTPFDIKLYFSILVCMFAISVMTFPLQLTKNTPTDINSLPIGQKMSADVIVFSFLPADWDYTLKWNLTYELIPWSMLFIIWKINKNNFGNVINNAV